MDHLRRGLSPVTDEGWEAIDAEATRTLRHYLAARPLVGFDSPAGWDKSAHNLGRVEPVAPPMAGVEAAKRAALAEDHIVFRGFKEGHVTGIAEAAPYPPIQMDDNYADYPKLVARAVSTLREAGIDGPYAAALGPRCWTGVVETTEYGGYPVLEHLRLILGGPVVWAPAVDGAVVLSQRGHDFRFVAGQDFAIGYAGTDGDRVRLYIEESFTFEVLEPRAAVSLTYPSRKR